MIISIYSSLFHFKNNNFIFEFFSLNVYLIFFYALNCITDLIPLVIWILIQPVVVLIKLLRLTNQSRKMSYQIINFKYIDKIFQAIIYYFRRHYHYFPGDINCILIISELVFLFILFSSTIISDTNLELFINFSGNSS